jgi:hypothetical protein
MSGGDEDNVQPAQGSPRDCSGRFSTRPGRIVHECRDAGGPDWLFGLALDLVVLALVSGAIWYAVRREARPSATARRPRRGRRWREQLRRTAGLIASVLLLEHWLLGLAHVNSPRLAVLGGFGFAVLLPVLAVSRLAAVARRQRPAIATPLPAAQVHGPIRWALPALVVIGAVGAVAVLAVQLALHRSC